MRANMFQRKEEEKKTTTHNLTNEGFLLASGG